MDEPTPHLFFPDLEVHRMAGIITFGLAGVLLAVLTLWLFGERWRLMRTSTWNFLQEAGLRRILSLSVLHSYFYGRWTNQYINVLVNHITPRLGDRGKRWLSDRYHGKVLTPEHARAIVTLDEDIPLRSLEHIVPYPIARELVLKGPPEIAVYECGCRHARSSPCQPTQVCMVIGQPFVDFVLEHNPHTSRRITQDEALELLRAEYERGHVHSAWFKDACLDRFYSICNCCKCCCGGIEAMTEHGVPMMAPSGYVAQVDHDLCTACGTCVDVCPFNALFMENEGSVLDWGKCMGCGVCAGQCPAEAISLVRDSGKGEPLDVRLLVK